MWSGREQLSFFSFLPWSSVILNALLLLYLSQSICEAVTIWDAPREMVKQISGFFNLLSVPHTIQSQLLHWNWQAREGSSWRQSPLHSVICRTLFFPLDYNEIYTKYNEMKYIYYEVIPLFSVKKTHLNLLWLAACLKVPSTTSGSTVSARRCWATVSLKLIGKPLVLCIRKLGPQPTFCHLKRGTAITAITNVFQMCLQQHYVFHIGKKAFCS